MPFILDSILSSVVEAVQPFFPYSCDLILTPKTTGTAGGQVIGTPATLASGLPLLYESLKVPMTRIVGGKETVIGTHKLYLKATDETKVITVDYEIHVAAYNGESAKIFVRPIMIEPAYSHLIQLAAVLKGA